MEKQSRYKNVRTIRLSRRECGGVMILDFEEYKKKAEKKDVLQAISQDTEFDWHLF